MNSLIGGVPSHRIRVGDFGFLYGHPHDAAGILETAVLDVYQTGKIESGWTVLDIGAGIGDFAVVASRRVGPSGKVIAIEPAPQDFSYLLQNLESNGCRNVIPVQAAISDREAVVSLEFKGTATKTRSRRLRDILSELGVDPKAIRLAKLDIEGAERATVPDNLDILGGCDRITIELHDDSARLLDPIMERAGYSFRRLTRRRYLWKTAAFCLRHPHQSVRVFLAVRQSDAYHGILKFLQGMEITRSDRLVVGDYIRNKTQ